MARRTLVLLVATLTLLAGCAGGGSGDDDGASLGETVPSTAPTAPEVPPPSRAGTGVVVIGGASSSFAVTRCELKATAALGTAYLLLVTGEGTTASEVPFQVEVKRFTTDTEAAETFTDDITYTDTARILQIQRFEVAGEVTDLRDPGARGTLLRVRPDGVSATGVAGPPGAELGDDGIVGMALDLTC